jgi:hypothetical protein
MDVSLHDIAGTFGVVLIVGSYFLVQIGRLRAEALSYSVANGLGALLVLLSLMVEFNLSAFLVEFFWLLISLIGVWRFFASRTS